MADAFAEVVPGWRRAVGFEPRRFICCGDGPGKRCPAPVAWVPVPFNSAEMRCSAHFDAVHPRVGGKAVR